MLSSRLINSRHACFLYLCILTVTHKSYQQTNVKYKSSHNEMLKSLKYITQTGPTNANTGTLSIASESFVAVDKLYEILLEVRKFTMAALNYTRISTKRIQVTVIAGIPPIMNILWAVSNFALLTKVQTFLGICYYYSNSC